jgi:hypothetical protein
VCGGGVLREREKRMWVERISKRRGGGGEVGGTIIIMYSTSHLLGCTPR